MSDELKLEYEYDSYLEERNEYENALTLERKHPTIPVSRVNTLLGAGMFVFALLIGITLGFIGASAYWWGAIALFGGMGLLMAVFNEIMIEDTKEEFHGQ